MLVSLRKIKKTIDLHLNRKQIPFLASVLIDQLWVYSFQLFKLTCNATPTFPGANHFAIAEGFLSRNQIKVTNSFMSSESVNEFMLKW